MVKDSVTVETSFEPNGGWYIINMPAVKVPKEDAHYGALEYT